jgi:deazaflavin-dependent oxidoreductase (nitroreductase family)
MAQVPGLPRLLGNDRAPRAPGRRLPERRSRKQRFSKALTRRFVNPLVRRAVEAAPFRTGWAVLETTGRRSGQPRRVPVGDGLRGDTFWIVTEHGWGADYVRNIRRDPRVRVKVGRRWRTGTAHVLPDDDPYKRLRWLGRPLNDVSLLLVGTEQLTVRIDLEP